MKILHINRNYACTTLHQLMRRKLDALGYENQVFAPMDDKNLCVIPVDDNVTVCECFHKRDRYFFGHKQRKIRRALEREIPVGEFDCIHAYTLFTDGNCAQKLSKKYKIPYVVAVRNTDVNSFFKLMPHLRHTGVEIMRGAKAIFFLSDPYCRLVFEKYVPKSLQEELKAKAYIIPNGIDEYYHKNLCTKTAVPDKDNLRLVFAGRIDANKNIPTILRAMDVLEKNGYQPRLTVVGKVEDKQEYEKFISDPRVTYLPPVDKEKLLEIYRENDIFVMPSFTESFGLTYVEAISQGLPVVYSQGQGFDNQFPEGEVGYRADAHSPEAVADAIVRIVENYPGITQNLSAKAGKYNWDNICAQYKEIYETI